MKGENNDDGGDDAGRRQTTSKLLPFADKYNILCEMPVRILPTLVHNLSSSAVIGQASASVRELAQSVKPLSLPGRTGGYVPRSVNR